MTTGSTFVIAAMDSTSNALARCLEILAHRQDVQEKLRQEIVSARKGQDIPYDQLADLPYLDAVCRETLRLYVCHFVHSEKRLLQQNFTATLLSL